MTKKATKTTARKTGKKYVTLSQMAKNCVKVQKESFGEPLYFALRDSNYGCEGQGQMLRCFKLPGWDDCLLIALKPNDFDNQGHFGEQIFLELVVRRRILKNEEFQGYESETFACKINERFDGEAIARVERFLLELAGFGDYDAFDDQGCFIGNYAAIASIETN